MDNKTKKILTAVLTVVMTFICIIGGLFASGNIDRLAAKIEGIEEISEAVTEVTATLKNFDSAIAMPEVIRGTKLFLNGDISASVDITATAENIKSLGFNTVFLMNSKESRNFNLSDKATLSRLFEISDTLRSFGLFTAVLVDFSDPALVSNLSDLAKTDSVDGIILSDVFNNLSKNTEAVLSSVKEATENTSVNSIICDVPFTSIKTADAKSFYDTLSTCMKNGYCSGIYTEPNTTHNSTAVSFSDTVDLWKSYSDKNGQVIIGQSEDFVTDKKGFEKLEELFNQLSIIYKADADFSLSTVFCSYFN